MKTPLLLGIYEFIWIIALLFGFIIPIMALVNILKSKFEGNNKLIWVIIVVFLNFIGAVLYYTIGRKQRIDQL